MSVRRIHFCDSCGSGLFVHFPIADLAIMYVSKVKLNYLYHI